jgi:hypothetical protein
MHTEFPRESIEVRLVAFFPQARNTVPDMTMSSHLRIPAAVKAIRQDITHLKNWDSHGKQWVKGEASKGNLKGIVKGLCEHHRREGRRGEFKDLTDEDIRQVVADATKDDHMAQEIKKALGITVPKQK